MNEKFDENSLNEQTINDVETARLALRWSLDKIRVLQEEGLKNRQNLQDRASQSAFLENQLKSKNAEIEKILRSHDEEMKSKQDSLEYQFRSKLERLNEREKELVDKLSKQEEILKQKENKMLDDYQKKSEELRVRWSQVESELWQLRQEQVSKQQEFEKLYSARLESERKKIGEEAELGKAAQEKVYSTRLEEFEKREAAAALELKKQEAVFKWSRDSWQKEVDEREKALKQKDLEIDKKLLEKNQEIEDYRIKLALVDKQLKDLPEAVRRRDQDLERYKDALASLEGVIKTLEIEKKNRREDSDGRISRLTAALETEKSHYRDMEMEIPKRLKIAVEHERNRLAEKLGEVDLNYKQELKKRQEEIDYLARNLKIFEQTMKTMQTDRESAVQKVEQLQTQLSLKAEENSFREKQLQSEYEVRLKVEVEKHIAALRSEIETGGRIYEDSLRMKIEEIAHLRKDVEEVSRDKAGLQSSITALRRELDALGEKREADLQTLRVQLKSVHDSERAAALTESSAVRKAELDAQAQNFAEERKFTEKKLSQLRGNIEALKIEREEMVLLEHEKLTRIYTEKEKYYDEQLAEKDREAARLKENLRRACDEKQTALSEADQEFEAFKRAHEVQEAEYRRTLEDFRSKLADSLPKTEALKKLSEERQTKLNSLQADLAQAKRNAADEIAVLSDKFSAKEKECRELKYQSETLKSNFEIFVSDDEKKISDMMLKLKNAEEQKAASEKQADSVKKEMEFWRASVAKKDEEIIALKEEFFRTLEEEKKQAGVIRDILGKDFTEKEKSFAREIAALRDALNEKDVVAEQLRGAAQDLAKNFERAKNNYERAKNNYDEERTRRSALENEVQGVNSALKAKDAEFKTLAAEFDKMKQISMEYEKSKKLVEQLQEELKSRGNQ
ncbi:MAG: hypothetical protein NTX59_00205 [Elusimicrobia bacterium]|nr:hypothetical protein [Elusimicrobiota bacterium]